MADENCFSLDMCDFTAGSLSLGPCAECNQKDKEIETLKKEQAKHQTNFKVLKEKIIATDQLLRQYRAKTLECAHQEKQIEEWVRKYEKSQREVTVLEAQLMKSLEDMEPVKRSKRELEQQMKKLQKEKEDLETKLNSAEFLNTQYEMRIATMEMAKSTKEEAGSEHKKKHTELESRLKQQGNRVNKLQNEAKALKVEVTKGKRREKRLENQLKRAESKLSKHLAVLVENGLMTEKARAKVMATVSRLDRNVDSDIGSDFDYESMSDFETDDEDQEDAAKDKEVSTTDKPSTSTAMPAPASSDSATRTEEEEMPTPTTTTTSTTTTTTTTTTTPKKQSQFVKPKELKPRTRGAPCRDVEKPDDSLKDMVMKMDDLLGGCLPFAHSPLPPSPPPPSSQDAEMEDEASASPDAGSLDLPVSPISNGDGDVPALIGTSPAKDSSESLPSIVQSGSPSVMKENSVPLPTGTQSIPSSVAVSEGDSQGHCAEEFGAGQTKAGHAGGVRENSARDVDTADSEDSPVEISLKRVTRRTYSKLDSFLDAGAGMDTREAPQVKKLPIEGEDGKNVPLSNHLLLPPSMHPSLSLSPPCRSLPFPSCSPMPPQQTMVAGRMSAMGDAGSDLMPFTSDSVESSASLPSNKTQDFKLGDTQDFKVGDTQDFKVGDTQDFKVGDTQDFKVGDSPNKPSETEEASREHSKTRLSENHPKSVSTPMSKTAGLGGELVSADLSRKGVQGVDRPSEVRGSLQNGDLFSQPMPQSPCRITRRMSSRLLSNSPQNAKSHLVVDAEQTTERSVEVGCDGQSKKGIKAAETTPAPLPMRRVTRRMSSRNNSECEVQEADVSKEKCALPCESAIESKDAMISKSNSAEDNLMKGKSMIKFQDLKDSEPKSTEKGNLMSTHMQGRDFGISLENEDSRQRTMSSSQSVPQRMVTRRMSSRTDTSDSEREVSLSPKKRSRTPLSSGAASSSTAQGTPGSRKQKSNFGFGECASVQPDSSMEGILEDFLFSPADLKSPEQPGKPRSRNSSEKENNEPPGKAPSPAKRQLVFCEHKTVAPICGENKTVLPGLGQVGKAVREGSNTAHEERPATLDVSSDESGDEGGEGRLMKEDKRASVTQPPCQDARAVMEDSVRGTGQSEKADGGIVKKAENSAASDVPQTSDASPQKRERSSALVRSSKDTAQCSSRKPGHPRKVKKSEPVSEKADSLSASSSSASCLESDSDDTSDLSFSDAPLSPEKAPARGRGRSCSRGQGQGKRPSRGRGRGGPRVKRRGQIDLWQPQNIDDTSSQDSAHPPQRKRKSTREALRAQVDVVRQNGLDESSRDGLPTKSMRLKKKPPSAARPPTFLAPGDLDDESSTGSVPVGSPRGKKKVPTIQDSDSSGSENADSPTAANKLFPKLPCTRNKRTLRRQRRQTPATVDSSDSEDENVSRTEKAPSNSGSKRHAVDSLEEDEKGPATDVDGAEDCMWADAAEKPSPPAVVDEAGVPSGSEKALPNVGNISESAKDVGDVSRQWSVSSGGFDVVGDAATLPRPLSLGIADLSVAVAAKSESLLKDPSDVAPHPPLVQAALQEAADSDTAAEKSGCFTEEQNGSDGSWLPGMPQEENSAQTSSSRDVREGLFVPVGMYFHHLDHQYVARFPGPCPEQANSGLLEEKAEKRSAEKSVDNCSAIRGKHGKASEEHGLGQPQPSVVDVCGSDRVKPSAEDVCGSEKVEPSTVDVCGSERVEPSAVDVGESERVEPSTVDVGESERVEPSAEDVGESEKVQPDLCSSLPERDPVCGDICTQSCADAETCSDRSEILAAISSDSGSRSLNAAAATGQPSSVVSCAEEPASMSKELGANDGGLSMDAAAETQGTQQKSREFHSWLESGSKCIKPCAELCLSEIEADCKRGDSPAHPDLIRPEARFWNCAPPSQASSVESSMPVSCDLPDTDKSLGNNLVKSSEVVKEEDPLWTPSASCSDRASADSRDTCTTAGVRRSASEASREESCKTVLQSGLAPSMPESSSQQSLSSALKRKRVDSVEEARESCESAELLSSFYSLTRVGERENPCSVFSHTHRRMSGSFLPPAERAVQQQSVPLPASVHSQPEASESSEHLLSGTVSVKQPESEASESSKHLLSGTVSVKQPESEASESSKHPLSETVSVKQPPPEMLESSEHLLSGSVSVKQSQSEASESSKRLLSETVSVNQSQPESLENSEGSLPESVLAGPRVMCSSSGSAVSAPAASEGVAAAHRQQDPAASTAKTSDGQMLMAASPPDDTAAVSPVCPSPKLADEAKSRKDAPGPSSDVCSGQLAEVLSLLDEWCPPRRMLSPLTHSPQKCKRPKSELDLSLREFLPPLSRPPPPTSGRKTKKQKRRKLKAGAALTDKQLDEHKAASETSLHLSAMANEAAIYAASRSSSASASNSHGVDVSKPVMPQGVSLSRQSSMQRIGVKVSAGSQRADRTRLSNPVEQAKKEMLMRRRAAAAAAESDGSCSTPEPLETQSSVSAPQAAGARKVAGAALPTQPAEAQRSAPLPAAKRRMAEELPAPSRAKKASVRSSFNIPSGSVEQRVEAVVGEYYTCSSVSVDSVIVYLRQITSLAGCWLPVVHSVIMFLKTEDVDLQPDIVKACAGSHMNGATKEKLALRTFMDSTEVRFMHLLLRLMETDSACERVQLMQTLWTAIFPSDTAAKTSITQRASMCRLFVGLCGVEGRVEEVRVLAFHIVKMGYTSFVTMILAVAAAWPKALARSSNTESIGVLAVLEHVVMTSIANNPATAKLGLCFERLCGWLPSSQDSTHVMARHIYALQKATSPPKTPKSHPKAAALSHVYELSCSIEMLCAANGLLWMVKNFLERAVRSAMMKWAGKGEAEMSPYYVAAICRLVGKVALPELKSKPKVLKQLFHVQARNVLISPHKHPEVEDACVEMLLQLAPLKPPTVFSVIQEWSTARQNPIPRQLKDRITSLRNLIKARVPCLNLDQFL